MFYNAFPSNLTEQLNKVLQVLPNETFNNIRSVITDEIITYMFHEHVIEIPYRLYVLDITDEEYENLNEIQKQIVCCMYTRNCNGYIREKYLRKLLDMPFQQWTIPFIVKLCDEYVVEILEVLYIKLKERNNADIQNFCVQNKFFVRKSYSRMISYWNEYYRGYECDFRKYIGTRLFTECLGYDKTYES